MRVGDVGKVELHEGRARIRLDLDREHDDLVRRDATVLLRPRTGLKDMFLALDPGSRSEPAVPEGGTVRVDNTLPDVNSDEILAVLDADTRAYLKLLIGGAGKGLAGRCGRPARGVPAGSARSTATWPRSTARSSSARRNLARLIHNYGSTVSPARQGGRGPHGARRERVAGLRPPRRARTRRSRRRSQRLPGALSPDRGGARERARARRRGRTGVPRAQAGRAAGRRGERRAAAAGARRASRSCARRSGRSCARRSRYVDDLLPAARNLSKASPGPARVVLRAQPLLQHGGPQPRRARGAHRRRRCRTARATRASCSGSAGSPTTPTRCSTPPTPPGPFRRIVLLATCTTYQQMLLEQFGSSAPLVEDALGVRELLADSDLCPAS